MLAAAQIHPIIVHFPIVFFLTLVVFDAMALILGKAISGRSCVANISAGLAILSGLAAVAAYVAGDTAYDVAISAGFGEANLETHEALGTWTALLLVVWSLFRGYFWWRGTPLEKGRKTGIVAIEALGALLIITTAYFGGQLVYELGVNVSRAVGG